VIEQVGNKLIIAVPFKASKINKTGITVTVDVVRINPDGTQSTLVTGGSASEVTGKGVYFYVLSAASVTTEGFYLAIFHTADATVDYKDVEAAWTVGVAGVENLVPDTQIADTVLKRSASSVEGAAAEHSLCSIILAGLESSIDTNGNWNIRKTDGTPYLTKQVTLDQSAAPITGVT
jgi:hypothetical protein